MQPVCPRTRAPPVSCFSPVVIGVAFWWVKGCVPVRWHTGLGALSPGDRPPGSRPGSSSQGGHPGSNVFKKRQMQWKFKAVYPRVVCSSSLLRKRMARQLDRDRARS